jgi:AraC-like DNA-binding protein
MHAFPRHSHDRLTVGVFEGDNGTISLGHASARALDGRILAIASDSTHSAEPMRGMGWTYRSIYPSNELVSVALEASSVDAQVRFENPVLDDPRVAREIGEVHRLLQAGTVTLGVEVRLLEVIRSVVDRHGRRLANRELIPSRRSVSAARAYLEGNFSRVVKLDELSRECDVSPFHLIRSFRDAIGMTPHAYLMQVRATRAREMLVQGDGISSIAYRCGFVDQSHLTRTFKRIFGVTPGAYHAAGMRTTVS